MTCPLRFSHLFTDCLGSECAWFDNVCKQQRTHGRLIDADIFERKVLEKYCGSCDDCEGRKCNLCWVNDMLAEIDEAQTFGEEIDDVQEET